MKVEGELGNRGKECLGAGCDKRGQKMAKVWYISAYGMS